MAGIRKFKNHANAGRIFLQPKKKKVYSVLEVIAPLSDSPNSKKRTANFKF
jgi:hypothetical protein